MHSATRAVKRRLSKNAPLSNWLITATLAEPGGIGISAWL